MPLLDDDELTALLTVLLATEPCPAHGRAGLNVCSECWVVSCLLCPVMGCGCGIGSDEDEMDAGGIITED